MRRFQSIIQYAHLAQAIRFLLVGLSGTSVDFSILSLLKAAGMATLPANSLSFTAGIINNFILNRNWTFKGSGNHSWRHQFVCFALVSLAGLALNNAIVLILEPELVHHFSGEVAYLPAKVIATGVVVFWNYFANRTWTFRITHPFEAN